MTETVRKNLEGLGIVAMVSAVLAFVLAIIPCVGVIAVAPGVIAIVLSLIGLSRGDRDDSPQGMIISGLVIGIVATFISLVQIVVVAKAVEHSGDWPSQIEDLIENFEDRITAEFGDSDFSIRIESGEESVVIDGTINVDNDKAIEQLEELERLEQSGQTAAPDPQ